MSESPEKLGEHLGGIQRILVIRPDRLGDVLLSTPVFEAIRHHYPKAYLSIFVRAEIAVLLKGSPRVDEVIVFDPNSRHKGLSGFFNLIRDFRSHRFDTAVVLQTTLTIAAAVFFARVPLRLGPLSKLHSYLFFNRGVRQRRSQVKMHESDYNLELLRGLGISAKPGQFKTSVTVSSEVVQRAKSWLQEQTGAQGAPAWIAVHPGMGGSALNWPESHYVELVRELACDPALRVLMTFGPAEDDLLRRYQQALVGVTGVVFYGGADSQGLDFLAGLLSAMKVVVAPSTGPLHLAVALGKFVVSFYPPIRVQSVKRWGPLAGVALSPQVDCGQELKCLGGACPHYPCMDLIKVQDVVKKVRDHL